MKWLLLVVVVLVVGCAPQPVNLSLCSPPSLVTPPPVCISASPER